MYEKFEKLTDEKKNTILQVSVEEFAEKGYEKASTDQITSRAGISKGILYHYFKNKKNLFLYVVEDCRKRIGERLMEAVEKAEEEDFFERVKEVVLIKQRVQHEFLTETQLVTNALIRPPSGMEMEVQEMLKKNEEQYSEAYLSKMLDRELLSDQGSQERVRTLTMVALEQITQKYLQQYQSSSVSFEEIEKELIPELNEYIDLIKYGSVGGGRKMESSSACPKCGSHELGEGTRSGYGVMAPTKKWSLGSDVMYTVCTDCGFVLESYVKNPEKFKGTLD